MLHDWLVLHGGALGDLVLTIQLARRLPGAAQHGINVISRIDPGDLSALRPRVRQRSSEGLGLHWLYTEGAVEPPAGLRALFDGRRVLNALSGADSAIEQRLRKLGARAVHSLDVRSDPESVAHICEQWTQRLRQQGLLLDACAVRARAARSQSTDTANPRHRPRVLIHPGSGGAAKCWPLECFGEAAERIQELGGTIEFVLGPVERERFAAEVRRRLQSRFATHEIESAQELTTLLRSADVLLGNDAGPSHLAALLGVATVTVFGPTRAQVWRPLGPRARALQGDPACGADWSLTPQRAAQELLSASCV